MQRFKPSLGYIDFIKHKLEIVFIAFINYEGERVIDDVKYSFFKGNKGFWFTPLKMLRYVKKEKPDVVLVQGLNNPFQVICMRLVLGKKVVILVQHHGEQPLRNTGKIIQKITDKRINGYLFTSTGNAQPWIDNKMISTTNKCFELLEASTYLTKKDKQESRDVLGITGDANFLWVGRLDKNKDPFTVLYGFEKYLSHNPSAKLFMIYQEDVLLPEVKDIIAASGVLSSAVSLIGKIDNNKLSQWYSAVEFYISGSHREGSGYALLEAMACGCIPVVTDIPSFRAITADGEYGILYEKNNPDALLQALLKKETLNKADFSNAIQAHFEQSLSFKSIAAKLLETCQELVH